MPSLPHDCRDKSHVQVASASPATGTQAHAPGRDRGYAALRPSAALPPSQTPPGLMQFNAAWSNDRASEPAG